MDLVEFFNSDAMNQFRNELVSGNAPAICNSCYYQGEFSKMCGRDKQLNWVGVSTSDFDATYALSPYKEAFEYSARNNGTTNLMPIDLQVDLSDVCNSACMMCGPSLSTRLRAEYPKFIKLEPAFAPYTAEPRITPWVDNPELLEKFISSLIRLPKVDYLHLLGGETLYIDSFYTICDRLIEANKAKDIIVGITTNCTVWKDELIPLISQFREFHLGLSIEAITSLNDYIRYPSKIDEVKQVIDKFLVLRETCPGLFISLRITPTIFSIYYLDELVQYMVDNDLTAESCNILTNPTWLRCELLPEDLRKETISKLYAVARKNNLVKGNLTVDTRNKNLMRDVQANVLYEYIAFLENYEVPVDVEAERAKLVSRLQTYETVRGNRILEHAPEFEPFLRSYGYK